MTRTHWLTVLLLVPWMAMAQAPDTGSDRYIPAEAPPLLPVEETPERVEPLQPSASFREPKSGTEARLPLEWVGGALGVVVGALPGLFILNLNGDDCGVENCESQGRFPGSLVGRAITLLGMPIGMGVGILGAGSLLDGEGQLGWTLAGVAAGGGAGALISKNWGEGNFSATSSLIFTASVALVGGIVGYEVSHHQRVERRRKRHEAGLQVVPIVTQRGGDVLGGLAGRF
ncbi:hypothetical protein HUW62_44680 [Myxococcus sp. AM011]|uniref:hypothetical protein n=1 Tax=Myxococcus sp. AM011 TaxID=2745200 RepID=UPI0015953FDC|nr:hypothetical protein [Myxococcus sp. AM011]NVJ28327.1 hypothetical protein [Myxococcus sp. AM011]